MLWRHVAPFFWVRVCVEGGCVSIINCQEVINAAACGHATDSSCLVRDLTAKASADRGKPGLFPRGGPKHPGERRRQWRRRRWDCLTHASVIGGPEPWAAELAPEGAGRVDAHAAGAGSGIPALVYICSGKERVVTNTQTHSPRR